MPKYSVIVPLPNSFKLSTEIFLSNQIVIKKVIQTNIMKKEIYNVFATSGGKKCEASPPFFIISLTIVEATDVYLGSPVRKIVSIDLSRVRLASAIVFSYSKSLT